MPARWPGRCASRVPTSVQPDPAPAVTDRPRARPWSPRRRRWRRCAQTAWTRRRSRRATPPRDRPPEPPPPVPELPPRRRSLLAQPRTPSPPPSRRPSCRCRSPARWRVRADLGVARAEPEPKPEEPEKKKEPEPEKAQKAQARAQTSRARRPRTPPRRQNATGASAAVVARQVAGAPDGASRAAQERTRPAPASAARRAWSTVRFAIDGGGNVLSAGAGPLLRPRRARRRRAGAGPPRLAGPGARRPARRTRSPPRSGSPSADPAGSTTGQAKITSPPEPRRTAMFVAMNRFKVLPGAEEAFEAVWRSRKSRLDEMPGFVYFHLLRGPATEDPHPLRLAHPLARRGRLPRLDHLRPVPRRPPRRRPEQAPLPSAIPSSRASPASRGAEGPGGGMSSCGRAQRSVSGRSGCSTGSP